jgi:hypothetical protein
MYSWRGQGFAKVRFMDRVSYVTLKGSLWSTSTERDAFGMTDQVRCHPVGVSLVN